jgi:peptidyl-prolyl cis-trans isomerase B (cyclophilin B)
MSKNVAKEVQAAQADLDFSKNAYQIVFDTTAGPITLDLYPDMAPGHCKNMLGLTKIGFYDGVIFHRVIDGFVIQGGCPEGTGYGGPGYTIDAEFNEHPHEEGILSMARSQDPNSGGSQFFICLGKVPSLDNQYTVFGCATDDSLDVVRKIGTAKTDAQDRPHETVTIQSAKVVETAK